MISLDKVKLLRRFVQALVIVGSLYASVSSQPQQQDRGQTTKHPATSEPRTALVIGNSTYKDSSLANPVNDAKDMAETLKSLGFEVIPGINMDKRQMVEAIEEFGRRIRRGGVGLFYFAGHGVQVKGDNYLIPIEAKINEEQDIEFEAVEAARVLRQMEEAHNRLNIVILDACRNNPFARSYRSGVRGPGARGLASLDGPSGTLIEYATQPGNTASDGTGRNGLYTQELLAAIRTPGLKVEEVFKRVRAEVDKKSNGNQVPWEHSSLVGDFYFIPSSEITSSTPAAPHPMPPSSTQSLSQIILPSAESASSTGRVNTQYSIYAIKGWTDSEVIVKQGQPINITITYSGVYSGGTSISGLGVMTKDDPKRPLNTCPTGALLAKIGSNSNNLLCLKQSPASFTAPQDGKLYLRLNVGNHKDNSGNVFGTIRVDR